MMNQPPTRTAISTSKLMSRLFKASRLKAFMQTYDSAFLRTTFREYIQASVCREGSRL